MLTVDREPFDAYQPDRPDRNPPTVLRVYQPFVDEFYAQKHIGNDFEFVRRELIAKYVEEVQGHIGRLTTEWFVRYPKDKVFLNEFRKFYGLEKVK